MVQIVQVVLCNVRGNVHFQNCFGDSFRVRKLENKGLRVNMKKTEVMFSGVNINILINSDASPCGVCWSGIGKNLLLMVPGLGAQKVQWNS